MNISLNAEEWKFGLRRMFYLVSPWETRFPSLDETPNYLQRATVFFVVFIVVELLFDLVTLKRHNLYQTNDSVVSACGALLQATTKTLFRFVELRLGIWIYDNCRLVELPWDSAWTWLLSLLTVDFSYYWFHRSVHKFAFLWAFHQMHHSSENYNYTTALRQGFVQQYVAMLFYLPECLFVPPSVHLVHMSLSVLYQFSMHTRLVGQLGVVEYVFNSPSHHRVHHGRNAYCMDKNFGGFLIVWDRLFATYQDELPGEPVRFGPVQPINSFDQFECQTSYFKYVWQTLTLADVGWARKLKILADSPLKSREGQWLDIPKSDLDRKVRQDRPDLLLEIYVTLVLLSCFHDYMTFNSQRETLTWYNCLPQVVFIGYTCLCLGYFLDGKRNAGQLEAIRCGARVAWQAVFHSDIFAARRCPLWTWICLAQAAFWLLRQTAWLRKPQKGKQEL